MLRFLQFCQFSFAESIFIFSLSFSGLTFDFIDCPFAMHGFHFALHKSSKIQASSWSARTADAILFSFTIQIFILSCLKNFNKFDSNRVKPGKDIYPKQTLFSFLTRKLGRKYFILRAEFSRLI